MLDSFAIGHAGIDLEHDRADHVSGRALPRGHDIAEEAASLLLDEALDFF